MARQTAMDCKEISASQPSARLSALAKQIETVFASLHDTQNLPGDIATYFVRLAPRNMSGSVTPRPISFDTLTPSFSQIENDATLSSAIPVQKFRIPSVSQS